MTDRRFKWLLIAASLTCIAVACIWKYPYAVKANATKDRTLGEYVYVDRTGKIHASRKCPKLNYKGLRSERIKIEDLTKFISRSQKTITFCPYCVSDKDYETINNQIAAQVGDASDLSRESCASKVP